jgi:CheY-like chemotaxis protein
MAMSADPTSSEKIRAAAKAKRVPSSSERVPVPGSEPPAPGSERVPVPGSERSATDKASGVPPRKAKVLVVEDEVALGRALLRWLRDYNVVHCPGIADALARIRGGEHFDVIVCDVMMPGGNAPEFYAVLLAEAPELTHRMLFMTGGATTPEAIAFIADQSARVVTKPLDLRELRRRVGLLIEELGLDKASGE